jgi:hypothetical protein
VSGATTGLHLLVWLKGKRGGMIDDVFHKALMAWASIPSSPSI